jgi:hypothetical protein
MNLHRALKQTAWTAFRGVSRLSLALRPGGYRYIFILGHVRSGSTLLSHILASHPDVVGAGETHTSYSAPADLRNLVLNTCELLHRPILKERYIVDQINHDYVADDVLRSEVITKCIVLLREPKATLQSMASLKLWPERQALDLYTDSLNRLTHYSTILRQRALLVEYDDLVDKADITLGNITEFLGLSPPLTQNYATHRMTARIDGFGDPSPNIKKGEIVRTPRHKIEIRSDIIATATDCYNNCRPKILSHVSKSLATTERSIG